MAKVLATLDIANPDTWPLRMTVDEVALVLRWSRRRLYDRIASGLFPKAEDRTWARDLVLRYATGGNKAFEKAVERSKRRGQLQMVGGRR